MERHADLQPTPVTLNEALRALEKRGELARRPNSGVRASQLLFERRIAVLFDWSLIAKEGTSPFWAILWGAFAKCTQSRWKEKNESYSFHLILPDHAEASVIPLEVSRLADLGLLRGVIGIGLSLQLKDYLESRGMPYVSIAGPGRYQVYFLFRDLIDAAVRSLKAVGCKSAGYWHPIAGGTASQLHLRNERDFREVAEQQGMAIVEEWVMPHISPDARTHIRNQGLQTGLKMFATPRASWPEALIITDDMMTAGALISMGRLGIVPGRDIRIVTHANAGSTVLFGYEEQLTRIEVHPTDFVDAAFHLLDKLMDGDPPEQETYIVPIRQDQ